jgi:hypothetical protein
MNYPYRVIGYDAEDSHDLNKSTTNLSSECKRANIVRDHAMILLADATLKSDEIF